MDDIDFDLLLPPKTRRQPQQAEATTKATAKKEEDQSPATRTSRSRAANSFDIDFDILSPKPKPTSLLQKTSSPEPVDPTPVKEVSNPSPPPPRPSPPANSTEGQSPLDVQKSLVTNSSGSGQRASVQGDRSEPNLFFLFEAAERRRVEEVNSGKPANDEESEVPFAPEGDEEEGIPVLVGDWWPVNDVQISTDTAQDLEDPQGDAAHDVEMDEVVEVCQVLKDKNQWPDEEIANFPDEVKDWKPPPPERANRKKPIVPDLSAGIGDDISVGDVSGARTFALDVEPNPAVRFTPDYVDSFPREDAMIFIAPYDYDKNRLTSYRTRWALATACYNSVQRDCICMYALFVLRWFQYCVEEDITVEKRFPAQADDTADWVATLLLAYAPSYVRKHLNGLAFLHHLHRREFPIDQELMTRLLKGGDTMKANIREERAPASLLDVDIIITHWSQEVPETASKHGQEHPLTDAAIRHFFALSAALLTAFFGMCRLKDVVSPRLKDYTPKNVVSQSPPPKKRKGTNANTIPLPEPKKRRKRKKSSAPLRAFDLKYDASGNSFKFYKGKGSTPPIVGHWLPWCKKRKSEGAWRYIPQQLYLGDWLNAHDIIKKHVALNRPTKNDPAFSFPGREGQRAKLTRSHFMKSVNEDLKANGRPEIKGHAFRRGGLEFYKFAETDSEITMLLGDWASSSSYRRYHASIAKTAAEFTSNKRVDKNLQHDLELEAEASSSDDGLRAEQSTSLLQDLPSFVSAAQSHGLYYERKGDPVGIYAAFATADPALVEQVHQSLVNADENRQARDAKAKIDEQESRTAAAKKAARERGHRMKPLKLLAGKRTPYRHPFEDAPAAVVPSRDLDQGRPATSAPEPSPAPLGSTPIKFPFLRPFNLGRSASSSLLSSATTLSTAETVTSSLATSVASIPATTPSTSPLPSRRPTPEPLTRTAGSKAEIKPVNEKHDRVLHKIGRKFRGEILDFFRSSLSSISVAPAHTHSTASMASSSSATSFTGATVIGRPLDAFPASPFLTAYYPTCGSFSNGAAQPHVDDCAGSGIEPPPLSPRQLNGFSPIRPGMVFLLLPTAATTPSSLTTHSPTLFPFLCSMPPVSVLSEPSTLTATLRCNTSSTSSIKQSKRSGNSYLSARPHSVTLQILTTATSTSAPTLAAEENAAFFARHDSLSQPLLVPPFPRRPGSVSRLPTLLRFHHSRP
ncbi:hypothetical protein JCM11641_005147 [Rhodosporidiobolus odoratus]